MWEMPSRGHKFPMIASTAVHIQHYHIPSAPAVENVPYCGWNDMSLTAYTRCLLDAVPVVGSRWHLNEKCALLHGPV
jgi:hypothetical protein